MFGALGGALPPVVAHLVADISEFSGAMGAAGTEVEALSKRGASTFTKMASVGKAAFLGLATAAILVGGASVEMASKFDTQMERVHTQAGASQAEVEALKGKVLALAGATGQGPEKLAEALYHVESVGYRGSAAMSVLNDAAKLATISGANLDDTTYGLTSVMQTFGAKAQDSAKWAAFFNSVVGAGDMKMEAFNRAVGTGYFSAAQTFGVSAQSAGAALAFMTDRGAHADEAATRLRMTLALIAAPSAKAATLLSAIGLSGGAVKASTSAMTEALSKAHLTTVSLADDLKKPDGLYVALTHLKTALVNSGLSANAASALLSRAFGGGKSDATILAMLNNLDTLKSKFVAVGKGMGSYGESWKATTEQFSVKVHRLEASLESLGIKLGNYLIPKIEALVGWLVKAADWCSKHQRIVESLAAAIGGALMVAMAAWIISLGIAAVEMIAATWPILLIIAAVAALVYGILWLKDHWSQVWGWVTDHAHKVAGAVSDAWSKVKQWTEQKWHQVTGAVQSAWHAIASWFASAWHTVTDPIVHAWNWIKGLTESVWGAISGWFKKWWPLLLVIFAPFVAVLIGLWNRFHQQVWDKVVQVWTAVSGWMKKTWASVKADADHAWQWVYQHIVAPVRKAADWVAARFRQLRTWLAGVFRAIALVALVSFLLLYHYIADPIERAYRWVATKVGQIRDVLMSGIRSALNWLSGVGSMFYSIGTAIVNGIISGVGGMAGSLFHSLSGLANGALSAAKSVLGINSPSKVFARVVGYAIPEGIAAGVVQRAHIAHSAVSGLSSGLAGSGGASSGAVLGAGAGVSGQAHTLNLTLNLMAKVDEGVLFRSQQKSALRYQKRNGQQAFTLTPGVA